VVVNSERQDRVIEGTEFGSGKRDADKRHAETSTC
jgi:hypothetical protein